jgi:hypothetical protein
MPDSPLISAARQWVTDVYAYNNYHLLKALEWLERLAPDASEAVRLATLTHDMERAFPGPDQPVHHAIKGFDDHEYNSAHAARSARIVGAWLRKQGADEVLAQEVERLIRVHEDGGWPEANLVQAADSLSFLDVNVDLFLDMVRAGKRTPEEMRVKLDYTYERIQVPHARDLALPYYRRAIERLNALPLEQP